MGQLHLLQAKRRSQSRLAPVAHFTIALTVTITSYRKQAGPGILHTGELCDCIFVDHNAAMIEIKHAAHKLCLSRSQIPPWPTESLEQSMSDVPQSLMRGAGGL